MQRRESILDFYKLSMIMAAIVLAFGTTRILPLEIYQYQFKFLGISFSLNVGYRNIIAIVSSGITAAGVYWLILTHPNTKRMNLKWYRFIPNLIIPIFSTAVISITLNNMRQDNSWWIVLALGSLLLLFILIAEFYIVDPTGLTQNWASVSLIALSFALFLILTIALKTSFVRLFILVPTLTLSGSIITLRTLYLRSGGRWLFEWTFVTTLLLGQIIIGLNYFDIKPVRYGLLMLAILYGLVSLFAGIINKKKRFSLYGEPLSMFFLIVLVALVFGN